MSPGLSKQQLGRLLTSGQGWFLHLPLTFTILPHSQSTEILYITVYYTNRYIKQTDETINCKLLPCKQSWGAPISYIYFELLGSYKLYIHMYIYIYTEILELDGIILSGSMDV